MQQIVVFIVNSLQGRVFLHVILTHKVVKIRSDALQNSILFLTNLLYLFVPCLHSLKHQPNLFDRVVITGHHDSLPPFSRQLRKHLRLEPANHQPLLQHQVEFAHVAGPGPVDTEVRFSGAAEPETEIFEGEKYVGA